jgi:hypothetical protein
MQNELDDLFSAGMLDVEWVPEIDGKKPTVTFETNADMLVYDEGGNYV